MCYFCDRRFLRLLLEAELLELWVDLGGLPKATTTNQTRAAPSATQLSINPPEVYSEIGIPLSLIFGMGKLMISITKPATRAIMGGCNLPNFILKMFDTWR